jgi:hypothetical protein
VAPRDTHASLATMSAGERRDFARALKSLLVRYDNLWRMSFPYVMTLHQAPTDGGDYGASTFHIQCHPPLRKPHLLKYLAGPEIGGGNFLSDTRPEAKAPSCSRCRTSTTAMRDPRAARPILRCTRRCATRSWPRPSGAALEAMASVDRDGDGRHDLRDRRRSARRSSTRSRRRCARDRRSSWWPRGCRRTRVYPRASTRRRPTAGSSSTRSTAPAA